MDGRLAQGIERGPHLALAEHGLQRIPLARQQRQPPQIDAAALTRLGQAFEPPDDFVQQGQNVVGQAIDRRDVDLHTDAWPGAHDQ